MHFSSQPCSVKGRLVSCVVAQSAEEASIKSDCTIGTLFSTGVGLVVNITLLAKTKQSLHLADSPPERFSRYHAYHRCGAVWCQVWGSVTYSD